MTGQQGFQGNLSANEILNQYRSIPEFGSITNIVFMGMGEPLDNLSEVLKCLEILTGGWGYGLSPTRVTVSTAGLINGIRELLEKTRCNLAVSLNSPFGPERELLMPVQKTNPASDVLDIIRNFDLNRQRRVSFEYILFKGINDTPRHVKELARVLNGIRCRINLIKFHQVQGAPYQSPGAEDIQEFRKALNNKGILTTVRVSRGEDIGAACGLLSTLEQNKGRQDE
jgi:23S rRNA (adenine2503-C2)-methyltransferase